MAQLIKLQDYISRYEWNAFRYPSQYIRFKQENWKKLKYLWANPPKDEPVTEPITKSKWKSLFKREEEVKQSEEKPSIYNNLPKTEVDLKFYFLDKLLPVQLKWATSTVTEVSFMDKKFERDLQLKYFLQRFPDTYLLMYYPIFRIKEAPIDGEIILISPVGIEIIYVMDEDRRANIYIIDDRSWEIRQGDSTKKILSPVIALKRTEMIIQSILRQKNIDFPVKKVILARNNTITSVVEPYNTTIIDKNRHEDWFTEKRSLVSPLKNTQLKAVEQILLNCQTTSVRRPEWEEDNDQIQFVDEVEK
ncbi:hypothetical protein [Ornithinibacillus halophilus]|uniref:Nuclease-related domain-containing protein n=1 Tax=Ornithinibacillus halophilus TaxID=930117 RepID=A0A1M5ENG5_9BACI|nr:hypothetical protein [Ornithinibacillus halophilus]SHF80562.1 hypothetical protein SAMN05216225_100589 [Ornithinibacillus halophilus]